jgi:hypothetical protein
MSKFSKDQIEIMRKAYGTLKTMNPSSPTYKKFIKFLGKLPKDQLKQLAAANIKFVSMLAKNRLRGESVNEGKFGKFDTGAAFKGNGLTVYDRNQEQAGDYKDIAHIGEDGKITIWDKNIKKEPKLMQSLKGISKQFKDTFKESVNETMSKAEIKKARDEFKKTGELPPHLKKLVKGKKEFEKKFKVTNVVIPGMEWMSKLGEEIEET